MSEYVMVTPPGWPAQVPPPGADRWRERAVGWLLETVTPGWARYRAFWEAHPELLARHALIELDSRTAQLRRSYSTLRVDMRDVLEPHVVEEALGADSELGRGTVELRRSAQLVADALRGVRWRPLRQPSPVPPPGTRKSGGR